MIFTREMIDGMNCRGARLRLVQLAVDAVADDDLLLARLDVDIAGALLDRVEQQRVDPADDRRLVGDVEDVDQLLAAALVLFVLLLGEVAALVAPCGRRRR